MAHRGRIAIALCVITVTGCLATQGDIRVLQNDLVVMRQEATAANNDRKTQIDRVAAMLNTMTETNKVAMDSLNALIARARTFNADQRQDMRDIYQNMLKLVEIFDQNQRKLQDLRGSLESRRPPPPTATSTDTSAAGPGPNQLFQIGTSYIRSARWEAARTAFEEVLTRYPDADVAADAQLYIGESFAGEKKPESADSVYAIVVDKYPQSNAAPLALFRRGTFAQNRGKNDEALAFYKAVVEKYPRSDAAVSAKAKITELSKH
jgi:tol-pal system protein YbgF